MLPESTDVQQHVPSQEATSDPATTSQHGQHRHDDLQASLHTHPGELRGVHEPSPGGNTRDATRPRADSDHGNTAGTAGLKGSGATTPPPRDRITEYENALAKSARKLNETPLFEVIKSTRSPEDKSSPIAKLPNG